MQRLIFSLTIAVTRALEVEECRSLTGEVCTFPFTFNNTEYTACTGVGHPIGRPRCLIQVISGDQTLHSIISST